MKILTKQTVTFLTVTFCIEHLPTVTGTYNNKRITVLKQGNMDDLEEDMSDFPQMG